MDGILTSAPHWAHNRRRRMYAHLCAVQSKEDVSQALLKIQIDPVFAEASAFPCAYRIREHETAEVVEEYQDSGELFAGRSLLDLLRYWEIENVFLATSCFDNDSGFTLRATSSERSRSILSCAKRLLEMCAPPKTSISSEIQHGVNTVELDLSQIQQVRNCKMRRLRTSEWTESSNVKKAESPVLVTKLCNLLPEDMVTLKILSRTESLARRTYNLTVSIEKVLNIDKKNQLRLRGEYDKKLLFLASQLAKPKNQPLMYEIKSTLNEGNQDHKTRVFALFFRWLRKLCTIVEQMQREPGGLEFSVRAQKLDTKQPRQLQQNISTRIS